MAVRVLILLIAAVLAGASSVSIADLDGQLRHPLAPARRAGLLLFVTTDCPISNSYAVEISRVCADYASRGVDCLLLYEDARVTTDAVRAHRQAYGFGRLPAAVDRERTVASAVGASITPEAAVIDRDGTIQYRGRIDDLFIDLRRRRSAARTHDVRDALDAVLAGARVVNPRTSALGCYIAPPWHEKESR